MSPEAGALTCGQGNSVTVQLAVQHRSIHLTCRLRAQQRLIQCCVFMHCIFDRCSRQIATPHNRLSDTMWTVMHFFLQPAQIRCKHIR